VVKKTRRGKGEGSIYKRKDGRWSAYQHIGYTEKGHEKRKYFYGRTRQEVRNKLQKYQLRGLAGNFKDPGQLTFGKWLKLWVKNYIVFSVKQSTLERYEQNIRVHLAPVLGDIKIQNLQTAHLQDLYLKKIETLSPRTVQYIHTTANAALNQAEKEGLIIKNPARAAKLPKIPKREIETYSKEDVEAFLKLSKERTRYFPALLLSVATGLRRGEILGLRWADLDLKKGKLTVKRTLARTENGLSFEEPKSELSKRSLQLPCFVVKTLEEHRKKQLEEKIKYKPIYEDNNLVFCTEHGRPVFPRNFSRVFENIAKKLHEEGRPRLTLHGLRHTYATLAIEAGVPVKTVQENLGHHSASFTLSIYAHATDKARKEGAEKMDRILSF